jgi:hypothetical protein
MTVGEGEDAREVLVTTFDHYTLMIDLPDLTQRTFQNKARRTYTNPTIQPRIVKYTTVARQVRGPDFDPVREPLDPESVVRIGESRKHGRYFVGNSLLVPRDVSTLSQVRCRDRVTSSAPPIERRPNVTETLHATFQVISVLSVLH